MDILERFYTHVDQSGGPNACWPWTGTSRNAAGYGAFVVQGKTEVASRWILGYLRGSSLIYPQELACHKKICQGFKGCCNPDHLYIGTPTDNARDAVQDGKHWGAANWAKTHCVQGHEFTEENTCRFGPEDRLRYCRTCKRITGRETARKKRRAKGVPERVGGPYLP